MSSRFCFSVSRAGGNREMLNRPSAYLVPKLLFGNTATETPFRGRCDDNGLVRSNG